MIEMRVPDHDPIGPSDLGDTETDGWSARYPVNVSIEKNDQIADRESERRASQPIESGGHKIPSSLLLASGRADFLLLSASVFPQTVSALSSLWVRSHTDNTAETYSAESN